RYISLFNYPHTSHIYTLSLHDALPIWTYVIDRGFQLKYIIVLAVVGGGVSALFGAMMYLAHLDAARALPVPPLLQQTWERSENRSEEHTSELQSRENLVCRLLLEKKKK